MASFFLEWRAAWRTPRLLEFLIMRGWVLLLILLACLSISCYAQQDPPSDPQSSQAEQNQEPPRSDAQKARDRSAEAGESSSRDTRIDLSPPKDDAKNHPNSGLAAPEAVPGAPADTSAAGDVQELHPWNPYRALKDDEVGDYYFRRKNFKAALARYQDALTWKDKDALATFRMAQCYERLDQPDQSIANYQQYLKILPEGPFARDARKALEKLGAPEKSETSQAQPKQ
jgi:tetratricopeptide (TPR) repeat protein